MSNLKLSYSAVTKYQTCSEQYRLHYRERIRSEFVSSPLFFGGAIDLALNATLMSLSEPQKTEPEVLFTNALQTVDLNGEKVDTRFSPYVEYFNSDFDPDLLTTDDIAELNAFDPEVEDVLGFMEECFATKKTTPLSLQDLKLHNYACWLSLKRKGLLLIERYKKEVLPLIETVHGVQVAVSLPNAEGDEYIGFIDAIVSFKDEPGVRYILDNKTSSTPYKEDRVRNSPQLASYCESQGIPKAAYCVIEKKLRKKEPIVRINIIRDVVSQETIEKVFDEIDDVLYNIREEKFEQNRDACFQFGQPCPYYNYCRSNGEKLDGLVKLKERK